MQNSNDHNPSDSFIPVLLLIAAAAIFAGGYFAGARECRQTVKRLLAEDDAAICTVTNLR